MAGNVFEGAVEIGSGLKPAIQHEIDKRSVWRFEHEALGLRNSIARQPAADRHSPFFTDRFGTLALWSSPPGLAGYWEMRDWEAAGIAPQDIVAA